MSIDHTFIGTWEIVNCTFEKKSEISGLEGIKFRLDDTSDITWYNDLVSPIPQSKDCGICCDSASVLFSCETYDVNESNPRLIFGAFAGHSIEFRTNTLTPTDTLILECENWYALECKRLKDNQAVGQEKEFNFIEALNVSYFSDVVIKSSNGDEFHAHSVILRLNGFDCSMCVLENAPTTIAHTVCKVQQENGQHKDKYRESISGPNTPSNIKISVACPRAATQSDLEDNQKSLPRLNLSPIYLQPPTEYSNIGSILGFSGNLSSHRNHQLSNSFNCLPTNAKLNDKNCINFQNVELSGVGNKRHLPLASHSDTHLETQAVHCKNIFNFCQDMVLQSTESNTVCNVRRPPLSPYRARSPSPFPSSMETPPSSPLTPVGVLFNLPTFLLRPILHWLYTESLMSEMNEEVCEKLINFAETQPSLTKMVEPTRKYLTLIRLKKFVVDIIMDLHDLLNRIIQAINPVTISHEPSQLCACFKNCLRECAIGCAKVLQFCNIFIKDATDISRYQKNEIIKYVRTRIPIFMSQIHQLLRNILNVLISLTIEEKADLVNYLVPEIETTLLVLTNVIEEIKNSLEKMCKDLKCSHLDLATKQDVDNAVTMQLQSNTILTTPINLNVDETSAQHFIAPSLLASRRLPVALTLYDQPHENQRFLTVENNLKFVLYMYEVRKMRDIYGRISTALDIIRNKKVTFCGMDFLSKRSTIHQNLEQLIEDIPTYVLIVENWSDRLDEKLAWKEFKFCFKLATSQINGVIVKLFDHKSALRDPINEVCKIVKKSEFTQSLIDLGLIESSNILKIDIGDHENNITCKNTEWRNNYDSKNINLIRHLCESPLTINSNLSKNALRLLHSAQLADMEFEVHTGIGKSCSTIVDIPNITVLHDNLCDMENVHPKHSVQNNSARNVHTFKAHRVIVSARCEWFKKALLSGMQESITKKIIITDTTPVIFRRLLLYLYGAPIDKTVGAEQICELMLLADRYSIDDLKELCENTLNSLVDEESVLCLLGIADRYMASALKSNCMTFLSQHAYVTKVDIFKELPQALQLEVMDLINWFGRVSEPWNDGFKSRSSSRHSLKSPSKPRSRSRKSSPSYI